MVLTDKDKEDIKQLYADGAPQALIAEKYKVSASHINHVINGTVSKPYPPELLREWDEVRKWLLTGKRKAAATNTTETEAGHD